MVRFQEKTLQFNSLVQTQYLFKEGHPNSRLIILNHGYMSTNLRIWNRFIDRLPEDLNVVAPNGPYPIPTRDGDGWKVGYSWFFYDNATEEFLVGYDIPKDFMKNFVQTLGFENHKKTIIGFSQGGYASVHMAESLKNLDHVIGIGCQFKIKSPRWTEDLRVDALHGESDDIVSIEGARKFFGELPEQNRGHFESFPGVGHKPSVEMLDRATQWVVEKK